MSPEEEDEDEEDEEEISSLESETHHSLLSHGVKRSKKKCLPHLELKIKKDKKPFFS